VASSTLGEEYILALIVEFDSGRFGIALAGGHGLSALPTGHPVADHDGQETRVIQGIVPQRTQQMS